jgi:ribosomal protein L7/L12
MAISKDDILNAVSEMSVMDLNDLVKAFEEKFGVPLLQWLLLLLAVLLRRCC